MSKREETETSDTAFYVLDKLTLIPTAFDDA